MLSIFGVFRRTASSSPRLIAATIVLIASWSCSAPLMAADESPKTLTNSVGMKLTLIPPGKFMMGTKESVESVAQIYHSVAYGSDEHPQHEVQITRPFYLGADTVTRGQFGKFVKATRYRTDAERNGAGWGYTGVVDQVYRQPFGPRTEFNWRNPGFEQTDDHPVVMVSWNDAQAFCQWLGKKEHKTYRLPTEAEWEYACRAGTTTPFFFGDNRRDCVKYANLVDVATLKTFPNLRRDDLSSVESDGYVFTAPVGSFRPNPSGLYDMHGNVLQWCSDWYDPNYYENSPTDDPQGPAEGPVQVVAVMRPDAPVLSLQGPLKGSQRVLRGGGWYSSAFWCRSAARLGDWPLASHLGFCVGFRVAASLPDSEVKALGYPIIKPTALRGGNHPQAGQRGAGQAAGAKANDNSGLAAAHQWIKSHVKSLSKASQYQQAVDKAVAERQMIRMVFDSSSMKSGDPEMFYFNHGEFFPFKLTKQQFDDTEGKAGNVMTQTWQNAGVAADSPAMNLSDLSIDRISGDKDTGFTLSLSVHCKQLRNTATEGTFVMNYTSSYGMHTMWFKANKDLPQDGTTHLEYTLKLAKGVPPPVRDGIHHLTPQQEAATQMMTKDESMPRTQAIFIGFYTETVTANRGTGLKSNSNTVATLLETADK